MHQREAHLKIYFIILEKLNLAGNILVKNRQEIAKTLFSPNLNSQVFFSCFPSLEKKIMNYFLIKSSVIYSLCLEIKLIFTILIKILLYNYEVGVLLKAVILWGRKNLKV